MGENNLYPITEIQSIQLTNISTGENVLTLENVQCNISQEKQCKYYYSNCLIEAIRAKLKSPLKVKLKYMPAYLNEVFCPHLMWHDGEHTYDFFCSGKLKWFQILWHKGYIRKSEYDYYDRCLDAMKRYKRLHKKRRREQ